MTLLADEKTPQHKLEVETEPVTKATCLDSTRHLKDISFSCLALDLVSTILRLYTACCGDVTSFRVSSFLVSTRSRNVYVGNVRRALTLGVYISQKPKCHSFSFDDISVAR